ncbi:MAG: MBL fold metallo-hydrolase, partial [Gemmatimonadaceae bacterium]|nr:MBL fold metallo-hydrolase [Gemmatimonadaceae bacterium]
MRGTCPVSGSDTLRYGGNTSCVSVALTDGPAVVLDAGSGLHMLGRTPQVAARASAGAARDAITLLLTHQHSDHVIGLAHFAPLVARSHHVRIACGGVPAATLRTLVDQQLSAPLFPTLDGLPEAVRVEAFDRDGVFVLDDTHRVVALPAHHPGGAVVLRVDDAHGALLAYAPDNELAMSRDEASISAWRASLC